MFNNLVITGLTPAQKTELETVLLDGLFFSVFLPNINGSTQWQKENWGVSEELSSIVYIAEEAGRVSFSFTSKDEPPVAGMSIVSRKFPNAKFAMTYKSPSIDCIGVVIIKNGLAATEIVESGNLSDEMITEKANKQIDALVPLCSMSK